MSIDMAWLGLLLGVCQAYEYHSSIVDIEFILELIVCNERAHASERYIHPAWTLVIGTSECFDGDTIYS